MKVHGQAHTLHKSSAASFMYIMTNFTCILERGRVVSDKLAMKKYLLLIICLLLLSACKKDSPPEPQLPDDGSNAVGLPNLITHQNTDLTRYSTKVMGTLTDAGDSQITEAGFVVDTVPSPTILKNLNKFVIEPDQNGLMVAIITDSPADKTYYIRSYATNKQGTGYGNEVKFTSLSQKVFKGNVMLSTQQEVEEFGKEAYTTIDGSLDIRGSVTDLSPLKNLAIINYAFNLRYTSQLTTLQGMDSLEVVNASYLYHGMRIENNRALKSLEGLEKLVGNNGYLYIIDNDELTDLKGLDNLSFNHFGELRIEGCDKLRKLHGLEKLSWLDGDIMIRDNPELTDIDALANLKFVSGRIRIINNTSLRSLDGFKRLNKIEGIELHDNEALENIKGLSNLDTITTTISLRNNSVLQDLSGLEKIKTTAYLTIQNSSSLTSLKGLENLKDVKYKIEISRTGLTNLNELGNLSESQRLELVGNARLENILGLRNLNKLAGNAYSLTIRGNHQLKSLAGLDKVTKVDGQIDISYNQMLQDFCALASLLKTGWNGSFITEGNAINPTTADLKDNCP